MITISRLYDDYNTAARVYNDLDAAGISTSDITSSPITARAGSRKRREPGRIDTDGDGVDDRTEGAATGAGIGGAVGGLAGLLAGLGMLAIPGLGPVVAAGWLCLDRRARDHRRRCRRSDRLSDAAWRQRG